MWRRGNDSYKRELPDCEFCQYGKTVEDILCDTKDIFKKYKIGNKAIQIKIICAILDCISMTAKQERR